MPTPESYENPYQVGPVIPSQVQDDSSLPRSGPGLVRFVPIAAILMIVQGVLVTIVGLGLLVMLVSVQIALQTSKQSIGIGPQEFLLVNLLYGGMGILCVGIGVLQIAGGHRIYDFRSRIFGIVASSVGVLAIFTCYCLPTALGVSIFSLVVLNNPQVRVAFQWREQGKSLAEIRQQLYY